MEPELVASPSKKKQNVLVRSNAFNAVEEYNSLMGGLNSSLHAEEISPSLTEPAETPREKLKEYDESSVKLNL